MSEEDKTGINIRDNNYAFALWCILDGFNSMTHLDIRLSKKARQRISEELRSIFFMDFWVLVDMIYGPLTLDDTWEIWQFLIHNDYDTDTLTRYTLNIIKKSKNNREKVKTESEANSDSN